MIVSPARATYRKGYAGRLLLTLFMLFIAIFPFIAFYDEKPTVAYASVAAILVLNVVLWVLMGKSAISIHDEGMRHVSLFGTKEIEWRNVKEYRYRAVPVQVGGLIGALAIATANRMGGRKATTNLYLAVLGNDGTKINVTSSFSDAYDAIGSILAALHDQMRPKVSGEIAAGGAQFGPIRLSTRDLQWKSKDPVPLRELAYAELAGQNLNIKKTGKLLSLVSVRSDKVPNVLLLLEEMEKLGVGASRAKTVDPLARMR